MIKSLVVRVLLLVGLVVVLAGDRLVAQTTTTGAIVGAIRDQQGSAVRGATVKATSLGTNETRTVLTGESGEYSFRLLSIGSYRLEVTATGFAPLVRDPVAVRVTETVTLNVSLQVQAVGASVEVTSGGAVVDRTSSTLGAVVTPQTIVNLPLATRNYTQLMILSPGVSTSVPNAGALGLNSIELSSQGARASDNSVIINGIDAVNVFTNTLGTYVGTQGVAVPAPDSLEEFKVQTALYSAATGRNAGANIAVVTRSGTNAYHGTLYEFLRNDKLNANSFFFNRGGLQKPVLKQNQFGGTIGGPVIKDRLFFFGSYQGTHQRNGLAADASSTAFLPPLTNDRSRAALGQIFGGQKAFAAFVPGGLGTAVAADGSNINPVAFALLNFKLPNGQFLIPTPQTASGLSQFSETGRFREDQFNANLDYQFGGGNRISGKYFNSRQESFLPLYRDIKTEVLPGFAATGSGGNQNLSLSYTHVFSSRLINEARAGYTRFVAVIESEEPVLASDIGMTLPPGLTTLPYTSVLGQFSIGATHNSPQGNVSNIFTFADTLSYIVGDHSLQFGFDAKRLQSYAYTRAEQHSNLIFLDFASFLLGQSAAQNGAPFSHVVGVVTFAGLFEKDFRATDVGWFVQDDWRVSSRLSVNVGLRHEYFGALLDAAGRNSNFDFRRAVNIPPAAGTVSGYVVGKDAPGNLPSEVVRAENNTLRDGRNLSNFAPRIGFAYQLFPKLSNLVLRGGYGMYYSRSSGIGIFQNVLALPFSQFSVQILQPGSASTFQNPLPSILPPSAFPIFVPRTAGSAQTLVVQDPAINDPYQQHYSLNLQYSFAGSYLLEAGYIGTKGTNLVAGVAVNQPLLASPERPVNGITTSTVQNAALRVPFQGLAGNIEQFSSGFDSSYHALQVSLTKRLSSGLQLTSAYTYAKALDNLGQNSSGVFLSRGSISGDQRDFEQAKGLSAFDRKHRLVVSFIWQLPQISSGSSVLKAVVNGWGVAGLLTLQSGLPLTVSDSSAATIFGQMSSRAQFAPGASAETAELSGSVTDRLDRYFNTSAFAAAPTVGNGTGFGNSGRGILRGPDQRNLDFSISRRFALGVLGESGNLEFRCEAFNVTNTPSFGNPGGNRAAGPGFGVISGTTINPRILQFALKLNF